MRVRVREQERERDRERLARQANRRLATDVRQAALHATPDELEELDRLVQAVRHNLVSTHEAHACVTRLLHHHNTTRTRRSTAHRYAVVDGKSRHAGRGSSDTAPARFR